MISRLQYLQLAKPHPSTHVASTNSVWLKASGFKDFRHIPLGPCLGFKAKRWNFLFSFFFLFLFLFLSTSFYFGRHIGLLFIGVLNLLKVVNETRVGFAKSRRLGSSSAYC